MSPAPRLNILQSELPTQYQTISLINQGGEIKAEKAHYAQ
jgi:hypothetical protein